MTRLTILFLLPGFLQLLAQDPSSLSVAKDPKNVATICQTCDRPTTKEEVKTRSLWGYDIHRRPGGDYSITYDGMVWGFNPSALGHRLSFFKNLPAPPDGGYPFVPIKYRQGYFWLLAKSGKTLFRYDPKHPKWEPVLVLKQPFHSFEVGFNEQIMMISGDGDGKNRLIEVYEPFSEKPATTEEFPETGLKPVESKFVPGYWAAPVTTTIDEFSLIYLPMCGRLFSYDVARHSLREMSMPWSKLDSKMISSEYETYGVINLTQFPGLRCLQFLPSEGSALRVAYQMPPGPRNKRVLVDGVPDWVPAEKAPKRGSIQIGELNLQEGTYQKLDTTEDAMMPLWPTPKGAWIALEKMCAIPETSKGAAKQTKK